MLGNTTAHLYRMVMDSHICPYGIKSKWLLRRNGYKVVDHLLTSRIETDAFKAKEGVRTTPQAFIGDDRIGGYDDLRAFFGDEAKDADAVSYRPVLWVFGVALALAMAVGQVAFGTVLTIRVAEWFVAFAMALLAMLKLQDVESFSTMFVGYDLLGRRFVPYAYAYPYLELTAGVLMAAHLALWLAIPIAFVIGAIGAASVYNAVYIQKRAIKCACVGGGSNVPLGFVSLTENVAMLAMAVWMIVRP